jgi:DNA modification methylase
VSVRILKGDCRDVLKTLPDESVHCVVTSPPYWGLRDYGHAGQIGLEASPADFVESLVEVFEEVRRVLRSDGTAWINMGDSYATVGGPSTPQMGAAFQDRQRGQEVICRSKRMNRGAGRWGGGNNPAAGLLKPKDLCGTPWRLAFALQDAGWWLRQDIIWSKPNPMPESVRDRCTKAHEYLFLLAKSERYFYDAEAIKEPAVSIPQRRLTSTADQPKGAARAAAGVHNPLCQGGTAEDRNRRSVWTVNTAAYSEAHFATFPPDLIEPCILAGCPEGGTVLDPFGGAGTTGLVADRLQRNAILIELNPEYAAMAERRIIGDAPLFAQVEA